MNIDDEIDYLLEGLLDNIKYRNKDQRYIEMDKKSKEIIKYVKYNKYKYKYINKDIHFDKKTTKKLLEKNDCVLLFNIYKTYNPKKIKYNNEKEIELIRNDINKLISDIINKFIKNTNFSITKDPFAYYLIIKGDKIDSTQKEIKMEDYYEN